MEHDRAAGDLAISWYAGPRERLRGLFALAEDSARRVDASLPAGRVLVATDGGDVVGCLQLVERAADGAVEATVLAVVEHRQGHGIGRALVERAVAEFRAAGRHTLVVATAAADVGNLRFYQRLGFRLLRIERDAFTPADGYAEGLAIDGIALRDRVWLDLRLQGPGDRTMQLRVARHTERLDEVVRFYRDGIGLSETGSFSDHDGYDGVFLAIPGTLAHLELTAGGAHGAPAPHPESLLVLYLGDDAAVRRVTARIGVEPVTAANPYWVEHGVTLEDPDGFRVVLVPERWEG
jgi:GNAT superfamily N-acetyltransferase/catechol 2,3-dioxygenase-like lactoylglutathione lyase family enzyme